MSCVAPLICTLCIALVKDFCVNLRFLCHYDLPVAQRDRPSVTYNMSSTKRQKTEHANPTDVRVSQVRPLLPPACLDEMIPISEAAAATVERGRAEVARVLDVSLRQCDHSPDHGACSDRTTVSS